MAAPDAPSLRRGAGSPASPPAGVPAGPHRPRVLVLSDARAVGRRAARRIAALLRARPDARLALPTGRTPLPAYEELVHLARAGRADFRRATVFLLDEYLGLGPDDPRSLRAQLERHLLARLPARPAVHGLDGRAADPEAECARYERLLAQGGLDLVVLGIGLNGHIGFNEPGSPFDGRTRVVVLDGRTRAQNAPDFGGDPAAVPERALTVGIATILSAREVLVLATGAAKAGIVAAALASPPDPSLPATALHLHPRVTWLLDRAAAAGLRGSGA